MLASVYSIDLRNPETVVILRKRRDGSSGKRRVVVSRDKADITAYFASHGHPVVIKDKVGT